MLGAQTRRVVLASLASLSIGGCKAALEEDLSEFCRVVNEVAHDQNVPPPQKMERIESRKEVYTKSLKDGSSDLWKKLPETPLDKRYQLLLDTAKASGQTDWRCSAYERMIALAKIAEEQKRQKAEEEEAKAKAAAEAAQAAASPSPSPTPAAKAEPAVKKKSGKKKKKH
ncbi:MAG: hypothetical protein U1E65_34825 [Myxococcota bacterium]